MCDAALRGFRMTSRAPYGYRKVMVQDGAKKRPVLERDPPYGWLELRGAFAFRNGRPDGRTSAAYKQPSPAFGSVAGLLICL